VNILKAIQFVSDQGNVVEQARLRRILENERPSLEVIAELFAGQRVDGGFPPFWAQDYSSLDATCFRLAKAEQLGILETEEAVRRAVRFIAERQSPDGSWEEDARMAGLAPPWATPSDLAAKLYLTANCGLWLALLGDSEMKASKAAAFLQTHLNTDGHLPGFINTHWLACGLWHKLGWRAPASGAFEYLSREINQLAASELAWLINTLCAAGVTPDQLLVQDAAARLDEKQHEDGHWPSADGPEYDVHTTLEALRALWFCGLRPE